MSHIRTPAGLSVPTARRVYYKSYASYVEAPRAPGKHLPCGAVTKTKIGGGRINPRAKYSIF